jgi:signal peptidase I
LAIAGLLFIIYHLGFDLSQMGSPSMSPTLRGTDARDGDWVLMEKVSRWLRRPRRWEVVAFRDLDGLQVMKRVVGLPGEAVALHDGWPVINGEPVPPPGPLHFLNYYEYGRLRDGRAASCADGYFVLGDDSKDSQDSRFDGPLQPERIIGRPWLIVWPPARIGFVN